MNYTIVNLPYIANNADSLKNELDLTRISLAEVFFNNICLRGCFWPTAVLFYFYWPIFKVKVAISIVVIL